MSFRLSLLALLLALFSNDANAQAAFKLCIDNPSIATCTTVTAATPLPVSGMFTPSGSSPEFTPVAPATATATKGVLNGCQYDSTQKTLTDGQQSATSCSARGAFFVATGADSFTIANTSFAATQSGTWTVQPGNTPNTTAWLTTNTPSSATGAAASTTTSSALAANLVVNAGAANLYSFNISADSTLSAAAWWIMIYNATSAPGDGAVTPQKCYAMTAGTTSYSAAFPTPVPFSTGIVIGVGTNGCFTKAASTHAFISGDYK